MGSDKPGGKENILNVADGAKYQNMDKVLSKLLEANFYLYEAGSSLLFQLVEDLVVPALSTHICFWIRWLLVFCF